MNKSMNMISCVKRNQLKRNVYNLKFEKFLEFKCGLRITSYQHGNLLFDKTKQYS